MAEIQMNDDNNTLLKIKEIVNIKFEDIAEKYMITIHSKFEGVRDAYDKSEILIYKDSKKWFSDINCIANKMKNDFFENLSKERIINIEFSDSHFNYNIMINESNTANKYLERLYSICIPVNFLKMINSYDAFLENAKQAISKTSSFNLLKLDYATNEKDKNSEIIYKNAVICVNKIFVKKGIFIEFKHSYTSLSELSIKYTFIDKIGSKYSIIEELNDTENKINYKSLSEENKKNAIKILTKI